MALFSGDFGNHYPEWQMTGLELNDRHQEVIESIAGVTHFYAGDIERLNERFDLIVLIHALEHIPFPISYLHQVAQHLKPGGLLFIEVPHLDSSPFDITIADHCTHFTSSILRIVITQAGFNVLGMTTNCVPKELSLLAQAPTKGSLPLDQPNNSLMANASILDGERTASGHITWLNQLLQQSQSLNGKVGVFGTSIAATWLASQLDGQISFFVDEDDNRTGHHYMSCPVYKPEHVPTGVPILLPLRPDIALSITKRLDSLNINFILPPSP